MRVVPCSEPPSEGATCQCGGPVPSVHWHYWDKSEYLCSTCLMYDCLVEGGGAIGALRGERYTK